MGRAKFDIDKVGRVTLDLTDTTPKRGDTPVARVSEADANAQLAATAGKGGLSDEQQEIIARLEGESADWTLADD